jgi:hypothetical protein
VGQHGHENAHKHGHEKGHENGLGDEDGNRDGIGRELESSSHDGSGFDEYRVVSCRFSQRANAIETYSGHAPIACVSDEANQDGQSSETQVPTHPW